MASVRPTFHESWYRVAGIHPRLRPQVQTSRQIYRGQQWYVVQDHTNNAFFRISLPAYRFLAILDGQRTVDEAWQACNETMGDDALTQGEVIQLLGQLYTSNLLQADVPPDAHLLFARYQQRRQREVQNYLMSILFARIPLWDPDALLNRWLPVLGWIFSRWGIAIWAALFGYAIYEITALPGFAEKLAAGPSTVFNPSNIPLLYTCFALIKFCHEMGHAISCKKFGVEQGTGGEVHVMGIMLFFFSPIPYVDASSSWSLKSKWKRIVVGAGGMWVELAIAAVAAIVWARTGESTLHQVCYNVMFIASVSTIIFNANPLLRYDGYYMLSDLLEIPNLMQRSRDAFFYIITHGIWKVENKLNPFQRTSDIWVLPTYAIGAFIMRCVVSLSILNYLANTLAGPLLILAAIMALMGVVTWVIVPCARFVRYLATSPELSRTRTLAITTTCLSLMVLTVLIGLIPVPHHERAQGVVESRDMPEVTAGADGFLAYLPVEQNTNEAIENVTKNLTVIIRQENRELLAQRASLESEKQKAILQRNMSLLQDAARARIYDDQIKGLNEAIAICDQQISQLSLVAPATGYLVAPQIESRRGSYIKRGEKIGYVIDQNKLIVRALAMNDLAGEIDSEAKNQVEIRIQGRPDILLKGHIATHHPAGQDQLRWQSLGFAAGGEVATDSQDQHGQRAIEDFFEFTIDDIKPADAGAHYPPLLAGQRVIVRFELKRKPIAVQVWTMLLRVIQKRFQA